VGRVGPILAVRNILVVGKVKDVEDVEGVVVSIVAAQDIGSEFQQRGLSNTRLPNKNDVVWSFALLFRVLVIPCKRESTSLGMRSIYDA